MKLADVKESTYVDVGVENNDEDPKFKAGYHLRISNMRMILQETALQIDEKKFFFIKKDKNTVPWTYVLKIVNGEEIVGKCYQKVLPKHSNGVYDWKVIQKFINDSLSGKVILIHLIAGLIKKDSIIWNEFLYKTR